ncbi:hypothetical protein Tco_0870253 [Tanacetum coccineum]
MKDNVSQEHVCEEKVPLNNNIGKQSGDHVEMPSEAMEPGMDDHVPNEIDGAKCEQLPNHVVKKVEFADMEGQMQQVMEELKRSQKNAFFWKSSAIVFGVVASFMFVMN